MRVATLALSLIAVMLSGLPTAAQTSASSVGPYVIDVRGLMIGVPNNSAFYPPITSSTTTTVAVPTRAFGLDAGAHVYMARVGPARLGFGVNALVARGRVTDPTVSATVTSVAPQVSFNFGGRDGWSYVGAGYGMARIKTRVSLDEEATAQSGRLGSVNLGGGARWFLNRRMAAGFDIRFHRIGAGRTTPRTTLVSASVGLSFR